MSTMSGSRKTTKINSSHQWQLRSSLKNSNFNPIHLKATIFRAQVVIKSVPVRILNLSTKLVLSSCSMTQWSSGRRQRESKRSALITHLACPLTWRPKASTNYVVALDISPALRGPACAIFKPIFFLASICTCTTCSTLVASADCFEWPARAGAEKTELPGFGFLFSCKTYSL